MEWQNVNHAVHMENQTWNGQNAHANLDSTYRIISKIRSIAVSLALLVVIVLHRVRLITI